MGAVAVGGLLFAVLLLITAVMVWQGARRRRDPGPVLYVLDDAAEYVHERLPAQVRDRLDPADVGRILEWEMEYHRTGAGPAVLGDGAAIEYVLQEAAALLRAEMTASSVSRSWDM